MTFLTPEQLSEATESLGEEIQASDDDLTEEPTTTEPGVPDEQADDEGEGEAGDTDDDLPPSPASQFTYDDGVTITEDQARSYYEFERWLTENPQMAEAMQAAVAEAANPTPPPPSEPVTPPENIDLEDPAVRALWDELQSTRGRIESLASQQESVQTAISAQQEQQNTAYINRAETSFKTQHNLTDDEMGVVRTATERLGVLPSLMAPVDPLTGAQRKPDPLAALEQAFEIAYWQLPDFRQRELDQRVTDTSNDRKRKAKLTALGGSSGSVPRTADVPTDDAGRRAAMISEVAELMNQ